jgi:glycosyltransferase involved in cell wall biosynthesis
LGFVPAADLPALYTGARAFVYPSLKETFGKPLVEAMRCGVPIVASDTSSIPEVLGGAGLLVAPLDVDGMTAAICEAVWNEQVRANLIERGRARARCFSWEASAKETLRVIEEAVQNRHETS